MIREIRESDLSRLKEIHEKHYSQEFDFPDFSRFICAYVVENNDKIISVGGIRTIIECVAVTDKDESVRMRKDALLQILDASEYFTRRSGYNQIHAFVQEDSWIKHLVKNGFNHTKGNALVLDI